MKMSNLIDIVKKFYERKILVIGDIMLDRYIPADIKISPEASVLDIIVNPYEKSDNRLGGAANTAYNLSTLGAETYLISTIGRDNSAAILKNLCQSARNLEYKLWNYFIEDSEKPTTTKSRYIDKEHGQQVARISKESKKPLNKKTEKSIMSLINETIKKVDGVIVSDYLKGCITKNIAEKLISSKKPVFVDTKPEHINYFRNSYLIKPNKSEAEKIMGYSFSVSSPNEIENFGKKFLKKTNSKYAVITLGKDGMLICDNGFRIIQTISEEVFDVTGAGDTVLSALALSCLSNASVYDSAIIANHAAGIKVRKKGTAPVYIEELIKTLKEHSVK